MKKISSYLIIIIMFCTILYTSFFSGTIRNTKENPELTKYNITDSAQIYFLNVGQGDSILIKIQDKYMLIDAGNNKDGEKLTAYFKSLGIQEFEYVIGTHAHEDHIGGMDYIINNFVIKTFYMPDVITTTKTFEDVLDALELQKIAFETPKIDSNFSINNANFKIMFVGNDQNDLNNTSIVLKMEYGNKKFLFMGDATKITERKILTKNLESDVIKIGHHGSEYSTSDEFLLKVNPHIAIIEVGENNSYDHPKDITLEKLQKANIKTYRTDQNGTIILTTDGKTIEIDTIRTDTNGR